MSSGFWIFYVEKVAIVALVLAALYFAARRLRETRLFARSGRFVKVIESTMLSQQAALHVVTVGSRCFLIGSAAGGVTALAELQASDAAGVRR